MPLPVPGTLYSICGYLACFGRRSNHVDGSHLKIFTRLSRVPFLIIDDFLLTLLAYRERRDLLEIIEDRYQTGATIIASQCPIKEWLLPNSYKIEMRGDSMRVRNPVRKNNKKEAIERENKLSKTKFNPTLPQTQSSMGSICPGHAAILATDR